MIPSRVADSLTEEQISPTITGRIHRIAFFALVHVQFLVYDQHFCLVRQLDCSAHTALTPIASLSFSHNRVTIPPPSWINAAHRHGVKILGVLYALPNHHVLILINILTSRIFEHNEDILDLIRLLSGPDFAIEIDPSTPSEYYSFILADLARQRGFDGFLLNFEQSLPGGAKQANALSKWVRHLREELWKKVGPHAG